LDPSNLNGWDGILGDSSRTLGTPVADTTFPPSLSHRKRRRNKCISAASVESNIVLGQAITMSEATYMAEKLLWENPTTDISVSKPCNLGSLILGGDHPHNSVDYQKGGSC